MDNMMSPTFNSADLISNQLSKHGSHSLAYSTLQPGVSIFESPNHGYLGYCIVDGRVNLKPHRLVLGEPIAEESDWIEIIDAFLSSGIDTTFFQVGEKLAQLLRERGFQIAGFGYESALRLPFSLKGKFRGDVRRMTNRARAGGVKVFEFNAGERRIAGISDFDIRSMVSDWLATRIVHRDELRFLARPLDYGDEPSVRKFYATHHGRLSGLAVYDPLFRDGNIIGFTESIVRVHPRAPKGTRDLLLCSALEQFGKEGFEVCSLGLSPLAPPPDLHQRRTGLRVNQLPDFLLRLIYQTLNDVAFNFKGTQFKKSRYARPELGGAVDIRPVYIASPRKFILPDAYRLAVAMGVSPWEQVLRLPKTAAISGIRSVPALISGLIR